MLVMFIIFKVKKVTGFQNHYARFMRSLKGKVSECTPESYELCVTFLCLISSMLISWRHLLKTKVGAVALGTCVLWLPFFIFLHYISKLSPI